MAFGHCGIVAAASAVLADLEKRGILKVTHSCTLLRHARFCGKTPAGSPRLSCMYHCCRYPI